MKKVYRKWSDARLSNELAKALRRATQIADELDKRMRANELALRKACDAGKERIKLRDETGFRLAHLGNKPS